jgi:hypothetical protein
VIHTHAPGADTVSAAHRALYQFHQSRNNNIDIRE